MTAPALDRRQWLQRSAAGLATLTTLGSVSPLAGAAGPERARLVLVILRGGLDGLAAVPAVGDPAFAGARGALAEFAAPALPLDGTFALHPALGQLHGLYAQRELLVVHATGLPYRERSHFDAQQVLESGGTQPHELATGWLARALPAAAASPRAVALNTAVPLVLRGATGVDTWAPSALPEPAPDLVERLAQLYRHDAGLAQALARARALRDEGMAAAPMAGDGGERPRRPLLTLMRKAAELLARPGGESIAVVDVGGWDTHANQTAPNGALAQGLRGLDNGLAALREGLQAGGAWARTVVVVATEFGRTVAPNGTQGSDHGSGGAAFVLGGAVAGGRVQADWPGIAARERFEGRDLRITTDLRAVFKGVLADHLRVADAALAREVFPGSAAVPALRGLMRG